MRGTYGRDQPYTDLAARSLELWAKYERRWRRQFLHRCGVLWMAAGRQDAFERGSVEALRDAKIPFGELTAAEMKKRWPQINFEGIEWGIFEPECGYLDARASCRAVVEAFVAAGGKYKQAAVQGDGLDSGAVAKKLRFSDGSQLKADCCVFACGAWLGRLFPEVLGKVVRSTKQEVFFFGPPAGDTRFSDERLPVWADHHGKFRYGIPDRERRGFKIADDTRGPEFDPSCGERIVTAQTLKEVREYVGFRFPALRGAPLIETRVCQYEQTPDSNFIVDRHPKNANVWLVGGGSGHGFKHGPALGEMMAGLILEDRAPHSVWRLERFKKH